MDVPSSFKLVLFKVWEVHDAEEDDAIDEQGRGGSKGGGHDDLPAHEASAAEWQELWMDWIGIVDRLPEEDKMMRQNANKQKDPTTTIRTG